MAAAKRSPLRVATTADAKQEAQKARTHKTLAQAIEGDDYLEVLIAQRRQMVKDVTAATGPAKAALHRQIALASKEIAGLQAERTANGTDEEPAEDEAFDSDVI